MRLVTYRDGHGGGGVGARTPAGIVPTGWTSMTELAVAGPDGLAAAAATALAGTPGDRPELLAPLPHPRRMYFCGVNYRDHVDEVPGRSLPQEPSIFAKAVGAPTVSGEPIVVRDPELEVDYEGELALVIGRGGADIAPRDALSHVFGYLVLNDVSARAVQFGHGQLTLGKGMDSFCPMGSELVTADEVADPSALHLSTWVNGELRQDSSTGEMIFPPQEIIAFLSRFCTLQPGDLISTGTPAGVGAFRDPPVFLRDGDEVAVEITGIGRLVNPVVEAA